MFRSFFSFSRLHYFGREILFSSNIRPPGPLVNIKLHAKNSRGQEAYIEARMIIDTGADHSCISKNDLSKLFHELDILDLPHSSQKVRHTSGNIVVEKKYNLRTDLDDLGKGHQYYFIGLDCEFGLIGRDILNQYNLSYFGPQRKLRY